MTDLKLGGDPHHSSDYSLMPGFMTVSFIQRLNRLEKASKLVFIFLQTSQLIILKLVAHL